MGGLGSYTSTLVKKRRYWPTYIKGKKMKDRFNDKNVDTLYAWPGKIDAIAFYVFLIKEPDYVMNMMLSYGILNDR